MYTALFSFIFLPFLFYFFINSNNSSLWSTVILILNAKIVSFLLTFDTNLCHDYCQHHNFSLHQPGLWFFTGGYLVKRWFIPAAARARGQSNDLNIEILASNLFNCHKEVINAPPVPSISRCIHIVYRHKNVWEYQWSNFIHNCMSTFLHYVHCKDALLDCSAPGGERCESLTWVDEIILSFFNHDHDHRETTNWLTLAALAVMVTGPTFCWLKLTYWGRYKMALVFQTTFSNVFFFMKMHEFRLRFHWSLFLRVQLTIFQHWFR